MEFSTLISSIREGVASNANVQTVYGEPISVQGKTIIPVARIGYGFGGGSGKRAARDPLSNGESGGGGGGGGMVVPIGVVEITPDRTRYIPFIGPGKLMVAAGVGLLLGMWIGRKRSRRLRYRY
jgi:uncharacterized spore protein YtfJ